MKPTRDTSPTSISSCWIWSTKVILDAEFVNQFICSPFQLCITHQLSKPIFKSKFMIKIPNEQGSEGGSGPPTMPAAADSRRCWALTSSGTLHVAAALSGWPRSQAAAVAQPPPSALCRCSGHRPPCTAARHRG